MSWRTAFDSHAHLQLSPFTQELRLTVLRKALEQGIKWISCCSCCEDDWSQVIDIAKPITNSPIVIPSLGIHPWYTSKVQDGWEERLESQLQREKCHMGEIGLDYSRKGLEYAGRDVQEDIFSRQITMGFSKGCVISVHCVKAYGRMLEILEHSGRTYLEERESIGSDSPTILMHSFSGSADMVASLLRMERFGFRIMFSYSCAIANPKSRKLGEALRATPLDRLLVETDSPCQRPSPQSTNAAEQFIVDFTRAHGSCDDQEEKCEQVEGDKNFGIIGNCDLDSLESFNIPSNVWVVLSCISRMLQIPLDQIALQTTENAKCIFKCDN